MEKSSFKVTVYLDDKLEAEGNIIQLKKDYFKSKYYYFKHSLYSQNLFNYELNSKMQMEW